jgi:hypothetical protein
VVFEFIGSTGNNIYMRTRVGGSDNTASVYRWAMNFFASNGNIANQAAGDTVSYGALGWNVGAAEQYNATSTDWFNPFATKITGVSGSGHGSINGALLFNTVYNTTSYDGFTIYTSSGTMTGTIRVYGYQNS